MSSICTSGNNAGYVDGRTFNPTNTETPQGGVISPLLANIGLHGLEELVNSIKLPKDKWYNQPLGLKIGTFRATI